MMRNPFLLLAVLYTTLVIVVAAWTFHTDITMASSPTEHLLPGFTLMVVCLPSSLSLPAVATAFPGHFDSELPQAAWVTFCGLFQVGLLFLASLLTRPRPRKR